MRLDINKLYRKWFNVAKEIYFKDKELSITIVKDILTFSRKTNTKIPRDVKRFICKNCNVVLIPGINLRVRLNNRHLVYFCKECNHIFRYPYLKEKNKE